MTLSAKFDSTDEFSTYPHILEVKENAPAEDYTYDLSQIIMGRYLLFYRDFQLDMEFLEVEVIVAL